MGFITKCFIRKNTPELQEKLKEMGYDICPCANFKTSAWLDNCIETNSIHGVPEHSIGILLHDTDAIDCGENEELFLALAAMRDDTSYGQYWVFDVDFEKWEEGDFVLGEFTRCSCYCHVATVEEIIKHFTNE